jgi:excisionase family DNA binding protein
MTSPIQGAKGRLNAKRYYRVDEVAVRFSVSLQTVYRLIDLGDLKAIRVRECLRVPAEELRRFEKRQKSDF